MKKMLIVYYSWSNGNTERIAKQLQEATGADIVKIETVTPYPADYNQTVEQAQEEVKSGFKPEIKPNIRINDYDVIAVGTPAWWYTMAPAVLTFLSEQNWYGKTVVPFMTNAGWRGHVIKDIKKNCVGSDFVCEAEFRFASDGGSGLITPLQKVNEWTDEIKKHLQGDNA